MYLLLSQRFSETAYFFIFFISATEQTSVFPLTKAQCDLWPLNGRPSRFFSILSQISRYTSDTTSLEEVLSQRWRPSYLVCFFGLSYPNMKTSSSAGGGPFVTWKKRLSKIQIRPTQDKRF